MGAEKRSKSGAAEKKAKDAAKEAAAKKEKTHKGTHEQGFKKGKESCHKVEGSSGQNNIDCEKKIKKAVEKKKKQTVKKCDEGDKLKKGCEERVQKAYHAGQGGNTEKDEKVRKMREKWLKERKKG